jgi:hypothetical protein
MLMAEAIAWPYKLLQQERHGRFVLNLDTYAQTAGVPADYIDMSMAELGCSKAEIEWAKNYPSLHQSKNRGGLILVGHFQPSPEIRLMAMGAAFLRNFLDARVVSLDTLVKLIGDDDEFNPRILILPTFYRKSVTGGAGLTNWQLQQIYGFLVERFSTRRATIMHVDDELSLKDDYGASFHSFLWGNWSIIKAQ